MYRITNPPPVALELSRIILLQCQELKKAMALIRKNGDILTHCVEINRLENEADVISRAAIGQLFDQEKDPITLIKIKELIEFLEDGDRQGGRRRQRARNRGPEKLIILKFIIDTILNLALSLTGKLS